MKRTYIILTLAIVITLLTMAEPSFAGPGGKFASTLFDSFWGKIALAAIVVIFSPVIFYVLILEFLAKRRAMHDLSYMANQSPNFKWLTIRQRVKDCFLRVHAGWQEEDLSEASKWMTSWYWQNQQIVNLNKWKREGYINICNVKKIKSTKPLLFVHENEGNEHEGSMLVVSITAKMKDYLEDKATGKAIEGHKYYKDVETLWTFTLQNNQWVVSDIEEGSASLTYARMKKNLPNIKETILTPNSR